jgi:ketosteroid isomerase-like protein
MTTAHVDQDNLKLIQQGFEAFAAGDMAALKKLFHADAKHQEAPKGVIVGNYHGRDAIFDFFGQLHQETAGTLRVNVLSMAATGDQVFVRSEVTGQRLGNSLNADHVQIFTIADGQVTDALVYSADHPAEAAFWS